MNKWAHALFLVLLALPSFNSWARSIDIAGNDLIYGDDDRYEAMDYPDLKMLELSRSVAIRIPNKKLTENRENEQIINFSHRKLKQLMPQLCTSERFIEEYSVGDCSGFLISDHELMTAGHCMESPVDCQSGKWVFDFNEGTEEFKKENVYSCKSIKLQKLAYSKFEVSDYAIIELDRKISDRPALKMRKMGRPKIGTELVVIGHPMGLPKKITDGGKVSKMNDVEKQTPFLSWIQRASYFTANLDSYAGNSGSPVINKESGLVEGILIQGAEDFVFNSEKLCLESIHLSNSHHNTYEKVMRINKVPLSQMLDQ